MPRPTNPIDALRWVRERRAELDRIERKALFDARLQGQFDTAIQVSGLSLKKATALTRQENMARGKMVRWTSASR